MKLLLAFLWLSCLVYGVLTPRGIVDTARRIISQAEAIQSEAGAIREDIRGDLERLVRINDRCETGRAVVSHYGDEFEGRVTASGVVFHQDSHMIAHRSLPFGTIVILTAGNASKTLAKDMASVKDHAPASNLVAPNGNNIRTSWGVVVDRGPFVDGRQFDVSKRIMSELQGTESGVITASVLVIRREER